MGQTQLIPQHTPLETANRSATAHRLAIAGLRIDLALLLALLGTLAVQLFLLIGDPPQVNRNLPHFLNYFIPLVWLLLTAGALAPELRHRSRGSSALPPVVGLCLAAWIMMGAAWVIIVFNRDYEALWGFWHYERLDPDERIVFLTLVPLALAPGWPRLARWLWLGLRRRYGNPRLSAILNRPLLKPLLAFAALALVAWLFSDHAIASDGWGLIGCAEDHTPIDANGYREYSCLLLFRYAYRLLGGLGLYASDVIHIVNFLATLGSLAMIGWLMRLWSLAPRQRRLGWWLTFGTLGLTQMLMGHVEVYPLMQLGLVASLVTGVAAVRGQCHLGWCAAAYGLLLAFHLSGIFILPAMTLVTLFWAWPLAKAALRQTRRLKAIAWMLGIGLLIHVPLWTGAMLELPNPTPSGLVQAHLKSLNTGAERKTFIGTGHGAIVANTNDPGPLAAILAPANIFKVGQVLFYTACAPLLIVLLIGLRRPLGWTTTSGVAPGDALRRREAIVLFTAWLGYALYTLTWHNDYSWTEDWDLFSGLASLSLLGALFLLMPAPGRYRLPWRLVRTLCLFALLLGLSQHYFYHSRGAYLNFLGKISLVRSAGTPVQRFQFEHGWDYGVQYSIKDGRVIPTREGRPIPPDSLSRHR